MKWGENNCDEQGTSLKGSRWGERRVERCVSKGGKQASGEMTQASPTQPPHILAPASCPSRLLFPLGLFHWLSQWGLRSGSLPPELGLFVGTWYENRRWSSQPGGFLSALLRGPTFCSYCWNPPTSPRPGKVLRRPYCTSIPLYGACLSVWQSLSGLPSLLVPEDPTISFLGPVRDGKLGAG